MDGKHHSLGAFNSEREAGVQYARAYNKYKAEPEESDGSEAPMDFEDDSEEEESPGGTIGVNGNREGEASTAGKGTLDLSDVPKNTAPIASENPKSASQFKGVSLISATGQWRAQIRVDGKDYVLGCLDSERDAGVLYARAHVKYRGAHQQDTRAAHYRTRRKASLPTGEWVPGDSD